MEQYIIDIAEFITRKKPNKQKLSVEKARLAKVHGLKKIPTDIEILIQAKEKDLPALRKYLSTKPVRTISGVAVIAIMTKPFRCPHGRCTTCPGGIGSTFGDTPQSYTGNEPASMRAKRNFYDPYLQVFNRLEQYVLLGQNPDKVELIIMGGTFPSAPQKYQEEFVRSAFKAMNDFSGRFYKSGILDISKFKKFFHLPGQVGDSERTKKIHTSLASIKEKGKRSLEQEQKRNENSKIRCIGLTIETKPDWARLEQANMMLSLGCTRVELGVQSTYDKALSRIKRGHTVKDSKEAISTLKDLGFKINYHMMLGLPGVSEEEDLACFKEIFSNQEFKPDMLKIYPCMVFKGTRLYEEMMDGKYTPLSTDQAARLILEIKKNVPEYVRIMRVQRDIPSKVVDAGVGITNLRQMIDAMMRKEGVACRCIRCREIKYEQVDNPEIKTIEYDASDGREFFISIESNDRLIGFCRLRLPGRSLRPEITSSSGLIRELHVYGTAVKIGDDGEVQHKGFGRMLMAKAESIAKEHGKNKMVVISGVGVRGYYRKLGYRRQGPYMAKQLK